MVVLICKFFNEVLVFDFFKYLLLTPKLMM